MCLSLLFTLKNFIVRISNSHVSFLLKEKTPPRQIGKSKEKSYVNTRTFFLIDYDVNGV